MQPRPTTQKSFKSLWLMIATILFFSLSISGARVTSATQEQTQPGGGTTTTTTTTEPAATPPKQTSPTPPPTPTPTPAIVIDAWKDGYENVKNDPERKRAGLEDILVVRVSNLQGLINDAKCLDEKKQKKPPATCQEQQLALYLNGRKINGLVPESGAPEIENGTLQFHLKRELEKNDEIWADLLGAPRISFDDEMFYRSNTQVSVGLENGYALPTEVKDFQLTRIRQGWFWVSLVGILLLLVVLILLARKTDILRDFGPPVELLNAKHKPVRKPLSLGRCQMAFWFLLVIASFLFIWRVTGAIDIITPSVLGLIGIGAGTALGSAAIDINKRGEAANRLAALRAEEQTLKSEVAELDAKTNVTPAPADLSALQQARTEKQNRLNLVTSQAAALTPGAPASSRGILSDLLKDENGYSFHRLQMFVWTLVLGVIFMVSVWRRVSMPDFPTTLLALMGISAGTFIGFKIPGN